MLGRSSRDPNWYPYVNLRFGPDPVRHASTESGFSMRAGRD
jgi:hypothetical protein